jgi:glutathione peroxidase-family protein
MKLLSFVFSTVLFISTACSEKDKETGMVQKQVSKIYDITVTDIDGNDISLTEYKGKVLLIVNVASRCGFTPQYKGLQNLYEKYQNKDLVVLGFPANNFGRQEPGSNKEIKEFCSTNFHVTFPMFSKISVKGNDIHPLYKLLTEEKFNPKFAGEITWNFNKFLINKNGNIADRFDSGDTPECDKVVKSIEQLL